MKRVPLGRRVPLPRGGSLGGFHRRTRPAVPPKVRADLAARSQGQCEAQLTGCVRVAIDPHHRITVKMGGRPRKDHDRLSNLIHLCRVCHRWVTARPAEAYETGLSLREGMDPSAEPVQLRYSLSSVLLDDIGGWRRYYRWDDE